MGRVQGIVLAVGGLTTLVVEIISLATAVWRVSTLGSVGLWQICSAFGSCNSYTAEDDITRAVQAFMIIACITLALAFGASVAVALGNKDEKVARIASGLYSFSSTCILVAMALFTSETVTNLNNSVSYGYSYILGWVAFSLSFILGIVAGIASRASS